METGGGYIKLFRKAQDNFLYRENRPHTRREAWEDILLMVNHAEKEVLIGNEKFLVKRGQSLRSLDSWAKHFNWSKSKVKRFFDLLKTCSMIVTEDVRKSTRLTVCNYDIYQGDRNADETQMKRKRPTNKNDKNDNKDNAQNDVFRDNDFLRFWDMYQKKKDRLKCEKKFAKLTKAEKEKIFSTLPTYVASTPDPQYRKNPLTYLNSQSWEDEVEDPTPATKNNNLNLQEYYGTK